LVVLLASNLLAVSTIGLAEIISAGQLLRKSAPNLLGDGPSQKCERLLV
jgi:hypothetical protein